MYPVLPNARLIYVMRHPIDRLVSHYVHEWTENRVRGSIEQAVADLPDLVDFSSYAMQVEPFLDAYGSENVLPVFYEYMIKNPQDTIERIGRFLGYAGTPRWNPDLGASNVGAQRLRKSRLRSILTDTPGFRVLRRTLLPESVRRQIKSIWQMKQKPQLSESSLTRLREIFDADLDRLGSWLGTSITCVTFRDDVTRGPLEWADTSRVPRAVAVAR